MVVPWHHCFALHSSGPPATVAGTREPDTRPAGRYAPIAAAILLCGCTAGDMRAPAAKLADAGVAATTALSADQQSKAQEMRSLDAIEAFSRTYEFCASPAVQCTAQPSSDAVSRKRAALATAIALRAHAVDALGNAYKALQAEASYDARADIEDATSGAIGAVNSYAAAIAAVPGAGPGALLIGQPVQKLAAYGAGLLAGNAQDRRILRDSREISAATMKLRDALSGEAYIFDSLADYTGMLETQATLDMVDSGLTPPDAGLDALLGDLHLDPADDAQGLVAGSPRLKTALAASLTARSQANIAKTQQAYHSAIGALNELIKAHGDLEAKRTPALETLNQRISELNVLLGSATEKAK